MRYIKLTKLLFKRLLKKPQFLILLCLIPILSYMITHLETTSDTGTNVGVLFNDAFDLEIYNDLQNNSQVINFVIYNNKEKLIEDVLKNKVDCGFEFNKGIKEDVLKQKWNKTIKLYMSSSSNLVGIAQEQISSAIFAIYSREKYNNYIIENFGEDITEANELFNKYMNNDSTFNIQYYGETLQTNFEKQQNNAIFSINLKGILAILIFIGALNSILLDKEDKENKRFITLHSDKLISILNIFTQIFLLSCCVFITLFLTNNIKNIFYELIAICFYDILLILYCFILNILIKKKESIAILIPILTFMTIICCPIFIDLSNYLFIFNIINKFFPITYYLML